MKYQNILKDIELTHCPVGEPDEDGKLFFAIDTQVMKFGSLQHDSIDWDSLISDSVEYLAEICKDYKVLQYLGHALLQQNAKDNLIIFLETFFKFNDKYLFIAYPKPSEGYILSQFKIRHITLIVKRIEDNLTSKKELYTSEQLNSIRTLLHSIGQQLIEKAEQSFSILDKLVKYLERLIENAQTNALPNTSVVNAVNDRVLQSSTEQNKVSAKVEKVNIPEVNALDLSNDRKLKQLYLQIADTTCEIDPASVLGYISRRYGLWRSIMQLPDMNEQGITVMQSITVDKLMDYRESVMKSPNKELLSKIEKSVVSSPYWIEGSYLAAQCCKGLHFDEAADAIRNSTKGFVDKHPNLSVAKFQNGEPFLPQNVVAWLSVEEKSVIPINPKDFDDIYQSQGFVAVLKAIDHELEKIIDVRTHFYLRLDKINYFIAEGISNMALNELNELLENSKKYSIEEWDTCFFTQLNQLKNQLIQGK